ncbi:MAG: hypothetical protein AAFU80_06825 [Pseudomonadota bacterium]
MSNLNTTEQVWAGLTKPQLQRLEPIIQGLQVALARRYGNRLAEICADNLLREVVRRPEIVCAIEGVEDPDVPQSKQQFDTLAREMVEADELSMRALAFSDEKKKRELAQEVVNELAPPRRMTLARTGQLDDYVTKEVAARLEGGL